MHSIHCIVAGLVQGVGFRYFAYREATTLHVNGYAKNLVTGEVELYAEGPREALEQLLRRVRTGPRSAMVSGVTVRWGETPGTVQGFNIA
jgi:acylphosphatase